MNGKVIGIFVVGLLIAAAIPAVGYMKNEETNATVQSYGIEWEYTYGGDEFDWLYCIEPTDDGGYIATGTTEESDMNYAWLLKIDANGNEDWSAINYNFNGTYLDTEIVINCVIETSDNGYIVGGYGKFYSTIYDAWLSAGYLWKVDSLGVTSWFKVVGNELEMWSLFPFNIKEVNDGFICGGLHAQFTPTDYFEDAALFKTDLNGDLDWYQAYDAGGQEFMRSLCINKDNDGYFISGTTYENDLVSNNAYYMVKTDISGNMEWDQIFDGPDFEYSPTIGGGQTDDGGFIMGGITSSYGEGGTDLWIVKTDETGQMKWDRTYGGELNDRCYGMDKTDDGYVFVVIKNAYSLSGTKEDLWLITVDNDGKTVWELLIEEDGTQWLQSIIQTDDNGYIIAGRNGPFDDKSSDGLIIKMSSVENQQPDKPTTPSGPTQGKPGTEYTFTTSTTDPDGDDIYYLFDWGDGTDSGWLDTGEAKHTWDNEDDYEIKVMAKDEHNGESVWSDPHSISIPRAKNLQMPLLQQVLELFPDMFPILRQLLGL